MICLVPPAGAPALDARKDLSTRISSCGSTAHRIVRAFCERRILNHAGTYATAAAAIAGDGVCADGGSATARAALISHLRSAPNGHRGAAPTATASGSAAASATAAAGDSARTALISQVRSEPKGHNGAAVVLLSQSSSSHPLHPMRWTKPPGRASRRAGSWSWSWWSASSAALRTTSAPSLRSAFALCCPGRARSHPQ